MINIYPADTEDFSTLGLAVLQPTECTVEEKAGGLMELEMKHPVDDDMKWTYLQNGCIIKAPCAVREAPIVRILDNVPSGATQTVTRAIYKVRTNTGARLRLRAKPSTSAKIIRAYKVGTEVVQLSKSGDWSRVVIKSGGATGWMYSQYLKFDRNETETVKGDNDQPSTVIESKQTRDQLFRIYSVGHDAETGMVEVKASHIFYDLSGIICTKDYQPENVAADTVLSTILANASSEHGFTFHCKVTNAISGDYTGVSIVKALLDPDIGIVPQTGARIIRDNYDVYILPDEVMDRGMEIRHRKNLLGAVLTVDVSSVVTRIRPVGKDKDGNRLLITENNGWVESANKALYPTSRDAEIEYDVSVSTAKDAQFKTNAAARAELKRLAQQDFADGMDAATVSLDVQLAALENSAEYADYAPLLTMFLYDTVHVIASYVGINAKLRVNGYVYDCLLKRYQDVYVGDISELEQTTYGYEIADGSVSGVKLLPGSVNANTVMRKATIGYALISQATIEQLAADSIVAVKANIKEIVAGQIDADALTAGSVTTDKLAASAVTTDKLEAGSVTTEKLAAGSVKADNIDAGAITAGKLAAGSVTTAALAAGAVTTDRLAANSVTTDKLAAGAVEADKISAGAVDTAQLAVGAVTAEKIASKTITADLIAAKTITAESGIIDDSAIGTAQIADGSITSAKIVELNADLIKTGTLSAERLLLVGEDGVIYKINAASSGLSVTELAKDQYKNYINGTVIVAKSITAAQIAAQSITGNEILAGSITAKEIDVSDLFADEATVNALNAMDIRGNKYLQLYVTDKVDNLSIGGRNLYTGTRNFDGNTWTNKSTWTEDGNYNSCLVYKYTGQWKGIGQMIALEANTQYTLSAWMKQTDGGTVTYYDYKANGAASSDKGIGSVVEVGTDWSRCHVTFTISTAEKYLPRFEQNVSGATLWIAGLKLEKGNKPTDWSPAPEDAEGKIDGLKKRMSSAEQKITADAIVSTVTSSTSYKTLSSTAEAAKKSIDGLNIGGRNYIVKSEGPLSVTNDGSGKVVSKLLNAASKEKAVSLFGQTVTVSFDWSHTVTEGTATLKFNYKYNVVFDFNSSEPSKGHYENTFVLAALNPIPTWADENVIYLQGVFAGAVTLTNVKVEVGNKPTDWSPAPEDIEARVTTAESKIDQKADSIMLSVLETKVDSLSIGGRNYIVKSEGPLSVTNDGSGKVVSKLLNAASKEKAVSLFGQTVTVSFDWSHTVTEGTATLKFNYKYNVVFDFNSSEPSKGHYENTFVLAALNPIPTWADENVIYLQGVFAGAVTLTNVKVEVGNKPTDWSPAPEDPAGSLSVSSDYSKVDINKDRVRIVSKQMEVAVPSDDGEDDVLRVDADGVHAEVVEADRIVSESVVHTQGAASYTPANAGELAEILTELSGKHLTGDLDINCLHVTSGNFEVQGLSGAAGNLTLRNGAMNALTVRGCDRSAVVYVENMAFSTSGVAVAVDNAAVMLTECILSAGTGLRLGANWPSEAWMTDCDGDCTTLATLGSYSRLYVGGIKPAGTLNCAAGSEVYNSTDDPTFTAASSPSIPTTQTVTVSLSPTQTYTLRGTSNSDGNKLYQGRYSSSQALRKGVMLFTLPADLASADNIDSATLTLKRIGGVGQGGGVTVQVRCYDVTGTLYASKTAYENQTVSIDVTAAVKAMKTNGYTGLMLYNPDTATAGSKSYTASYSRFAGNGESGAPVLKISYRK